MPDTKLTALTQGTTQDLYYGEQGGTSYKYSGLGVVNVKDYGALGDNSHDDTSAITTAIAQLGTIWFPPGTYKLGSSVVLPTTNSYVSGEGWYCIGNNATITGNFADFLFRVHNTQDNAQPKGFEGFTFIQDHTAGGLVHLDNSTNCFVRRSLALSNGLGFIFTGGNGPSGCHNVKFYQPGTSPGFSGSTVGVAFGGLGGTVQNCDFQGYGIAIMQGLGGGSGVINNRIEVCRFGVLVGATGDYQPILAYSNPSNGKTRLTLQSTIMYTNGQACSVGNLGGTSTAINAATTVTTVSATQLDVDVAYTSNTLNDFSYITTQFAGSGAIIHGNYLEANTYGIMMRGAACSMVGNQFHMTSGSPDGVSNAGIYVPNNCSAFVIQANSYSGTAGLAGNYYNSQSAAPSAYLKGANNYDGLTGTSSNFADV